MRRANRGSSLVAGLGLAASFLLGACTAAATVSSPPPPTPVPTPVITPDPHLVEPASVDDVFRRLGSAGIRITPNTATAGQDGEPVKRINGTYASWPLVLTQFTTAAALRSVGQFDPGVPPAHGESPYIVAGLNIMVEFGPKVTNDRLPPTPDDVKRTAFVALVAALDPLLGPLEQRAVAPVPLPPASPVPAATPAP